jgi:hypothetical protein
MTKVEGVAATQDVQLLREVFRASGAIGYRSVVTVSGLAHTTDFTWDASPSTSGMRRCSSSRYDRKRRRQPGSPACNGSWPTGRGSCLCQGPMSAALNFSTDPAGSVSRAGSRIEFDTEHHAGGVGRTDVVFWISNRGGRPWANKGSVEPGPSLPTTHTF